jgi:hypothetical protein
MHSQVTPEYAQYGPGSPWLAKGSQLSSSVAESVAGQIASRVAGQITSSIGVTTHRPRLQEAIGRHAYRG